MDFLAHIASRLIAQTQRTGYAIIATTALKMDDVDAGYFWSLSEPETESSSFDLIRKYKALCVQWDVTRDLPTFSELHFGAEQYFTITCIKSAQQADQQSIRCRESLNSSTDSSTYFF